MIVVTYNRDTERFNAKEEGDIGMCIIGEGATVAEAVGDYCIFAAKVQVKCDPSYLLEKYQSEYEVTSFKPFPRRG